MKNHPILSAVAPLFADGYALLSQQHSRALMARAIDLAKSEAPPSKPAATGAVEQPSEATVIIPMIGILTKYPLPIDGFDAWLGLCPTTVLIEKLWAAVADSMVETIIILIDSPGGFVNGSVEWADAIALANQVKPVIAIVNGQCCSGAYWAASQCRSIVARPECQVGNIGVYSVLVDDSKFWEQLGVTFELCATGPYKGLGADGKITDALREETKRSIDGVYDLFVNAVATGRGIQPDAAKAIADGRAYLGAQAKQFGLIDGVASSFDAAVQASTTGAKPSEDKTMSKAIEAAAAAAAPKVGDTGETDPKTVFGKTTESANAHKDQARAAMDAAGTITDTPDDDTKEAASQCIAALESCADESTRAADALSEKCGLDESDTGDDDEDKSKLAKAPMSFKARDYAIFGDAGFKMFYQGKSFATAAKEHIAKLEAENADLKNRLAAAPRGNDPAAFQAEPLPAANGDAGKNGKPSMAVKTDRTYADGGKVGDGRGLERFANGIKMPGSNN